MPSLHFASERMLAGVILIFRATDLAIWAVEIDKDWVKSVTAVFGEARGTPFQAQLGKLAL